MSLARPKLGPSTWMGQGFHPFKEDLNEHNKKAEHELVTSSGRNKKADLVQRESCFTGSPGRGFEAASPHL